MLIVLEGITPEQINVPKYRLELAIDAQFLDDSKGAVYDNVLQIMQDLPSYDRIV